MHPYRIAGLVLGALALFFIGFLAIGFLLPNGWEAERTLVVEVPPDSLFPLVSTSGGWAAWTPTPEGGVEAFGPAAGAGSGYRWDDDAFGAGEFTIVAVDPPREVRYEVAVEGGAIRMAGEIHLVPAGPGTEVRWREVGDFGWNPLLGYLAPRMNEVQGAQMEASLQTLRALAETGRAVRVAPD